MAFQKRKAFGQHFLIDSKVIQQIVDQTLELTRNHPISRLIEIGPGRGALTNPLIEGMAREGLTETTRLLLVEKDDKLSESWRAKAKADVLESDFLDLKTSDWLGSEKIGICSNLPYSASTPIVLELAQHPRQIQFMVLMFQAEVARRIRSDFSEASDTGRLTLLIQNQWNVRKLCLVPPRAFRPPPKVQSEVLVLLPRSEPQIPGTEKNPKLFEALLAAAFSQKRKMIHNTLGKHALFGSALKLSGIDGKKRAEKLSWEEWRNLWKALH